MARLSRATILRTELSGKSNHQKGMLYSLSAQSCSCQSHHKGIGIITYNFHHIDLTSDFGQEASLGDMLIYTNSSCGPQITAIVQFIHGPYKYINHHFIQLLLLCLSLQQMSIFHASKEPPLYKGTFGLGTDTDSI